MEHPAVLMLKAILKVNLRVALEHAQCRLLLLLLFASNSW
jgi:hypothetical protein